MFQREVAERLVAAPGGKAYGRLSVLAQWLAEPRILFDVPPRAFVPPPKVTSSVVAITPRAAPLAPATKAVLERVTAAAFGQRRKMLRSSLESLGVPRAAAPRRGRHPRHRPRRGIVGRPILRPRPRPAAGSIARLRPSGPPVGRLQVRPGRGACQVISSTYRRRGEFAHPLSGSEPPLLLQRSLRGFIR